MRVLSRFSQKHREGESSTAEVPLCVHDVRRRASITHGGVFLSHVWRSQDRLRICPIKKRIPSKLPFFWSCGYSKNDPILSLEGEDIFSKVCLNSLVLRYGPGLSLAVLQEAPRKDKMRSTFDI